jgi:uncharacterized membrane protein
MDERERTRSSSGDNLHWALIACGVAAGMVAAKYLIGSRRENPAAASPPVSKAFTINRPPEEVAQFWNEMDPLGDVVEHVRFDVAPGDRGTEVRVQFQPRWFGRRSPARVQELLRQFKQLAETGEIARSTGSATVREFGDMPEGGRLEKLLVGGAR